MDQLDLILRIIFIYSYLVIKFFSGLGLNNQDEGILQTNCSQFDPSDIQGIRKCKEQNSGLPYAVQGTNFFRYHSKPYSELFKLTTCQTAVFFFLCSTFHF